MEQLGKYTNSSVTGSRTLHLPSKMHKMHKRNNIMKHSCKGTQRDAALEWKNHVSIKYKQNTIKGKKKANKHPKH